MSLSINTNSQNIQGNKDNSLSSKGRLASKLASRHNRRKRRDSRGSAKKSRGKSVDRVPIPSFTPIFNYDNDDTATPRVQDTSLNASSSILVDESCVNDNDNPAADAASAKCDDPLKFPHTGAADASSLRCDEQQPSKKQKVCHAEMTETAAFADMQQINDANATPTTIKAKDQVNQENSSGFPSKMSSGLSTSSTKKPPIVDMKKWEIRKDNQHECETSTSSAAKQVPQVDESSQTPSTSTKINSLDSREHRDEPSEAPKDMVCRTPASSTTNSASCKGSGISVSETARMQPPSQPPASTSTPSSSTPAIPEKIKGRPSSAEQSSSALHGSMIAARASPKKTEDVKKSTPMDNSLIGETPHNNTNKQFTTPKSLDDSTPDKTESDIEIEALLKSSSARSSNFLANESRSSPYVRQTDKQIMICRVKDDESRERKDVEKKSLKTKRSDYFDTTTSSTPEVIELLDDDNDEVTPKAKKGKKEVSSKSNPCGEKVNPIEKKKKPNKTNQTRKKRKTPVNISRSSSDSENALIYDSKRSNNANESKGQARRRKQTTVKVKDTKSPKPTKKAAGKGGLCFACSTCKCSSRSGTSATPQKFSALSGSDARQEQSLVSRLQRIERDIAWKDGQRNDVARNLKRLRKQMSKKWGDQSSTGKARPQFLADADVDVDFTGLDSKASLKEMKRAQSRMFGGKQKTHQPTLTQIMRGPDDGSDEDPDENIKSNVKREGESPSTSHGSDTPDSDKDDFLSFWTESGPKEESTECLGDLNFFNEALANFKSSKGTGKWAKSTANAMQLEEAEEDEGFDALMELFDTSIENNHSDRCIGCLSQKEMYSEEKDVDGDTKPRDTTRVADGIEASVTDDGVRKDSIERMCPNWKENLQFTHSQTDSKDVQFALQNVTQAKTDLETMKERILQAFTDRQKTLELYEQALKSSKAGLSLKRES